MQAITGNDNVNYITSLCRFGEGEEETFDHIYKECLVFWDPRRHITGGGTAGHGWTPHKVLQVARVPDIHEGLRTNVTKKLAKERKTEAEMLQTNCIGLFCPMGGR